MSHLAKLKIGDFVLDPSRGVLTGAEGEIALEPKVVDVVLALAAHPGEVLTRDELIEAVWKTGFGADERVTRTISLLRKAFGDERGAARYIETVPKRGYRLVVAVERAPESDAGPAREMTETALSPPPASETMPSVTSRPLRTWQAYAAAGAVAALAVAGIAATIWRDSESVRPRPLVAVLLLDDLSAQQDGKAFAEGLSEEILYALSKSGDIAVAARSSSFQFTTRQANEAAKALDATHLVEGTVRKDATQVRVAVLLKDTRSHATIWSEIFERPVTRLLQVQDDIAWRVADALGARLKRSGDALEVDPQTYARYLRARDQLRRRGDIVQAETDFEAVVEQEPNFVRAWAGLAVTRHLRALSEAESGTVRSEFVAAAQKAIDRTLELDPENGEVLGIIAGKAHMQGHWREAEVTYDRALASEPNNATLLNWRHALYIAVGRNAQALADITGAHALDRLSPAFSVNLANALIAAGRFDEAKAMIDAGLVAPESDGTYLFDSKRDLLAYNHDWKGLVRYMQQPHFAAPATHFQVYTLIGETAAALAADGAIDRLTFRRCWTEAVGGNTHRRLLAIEYLSYVGDVDGALAHLESLLARPDRWQEIPNAYLPFAARLRKDRRFVALMARLGLWDYWRESGHWPDFCSEPGLPYDCKMEALRTLKDKERSASSATP